MHKILVCKTRKYGFLGFRFGPSIYLKIEVTYHECGKFSSNIIEGPQIENYENIFSKQIKEAIQEIIKELTFIIRRKEIIKKANEKKIHEQEYKEKYRSELPQITKASFDELTNRMRKNKSKLGDHNCHIDESDFVTHSDDLEAYNLYFGDTTKIKKSTK